MTGHASPPASSSSTRTPSWCSSAGSRPRYGPGIDAPTWAVEKTAQLRLIRAQMEHDLAALSAEAAVVVEEVVGDAYTTGASLAAADLDDLIGADREPALAPAVSRALQLLAADTLATVRGVHATVLRAVVDAYQRVVAEATTQVLAGAATRRQAAQHALGRLLGQGVSGFRDQAGRNWSLTAYVEMAVRTGAGKAAVQGHVDHLAANGVDLVQVSDSPRECPLCRPWEGKVLSLSGGVVGAVTVDSAVTGRPVTVRVDGTLSEARAAGLQHPNCRHRVTAYLPGASRKVPSRPDPDGYDAQQRQRAIERHIREWKRRDALALDAPERIAARAKVRAWQTALRDHLAAHPDLKRQRHREQTGRAI